MKPGESFEQIFEVTELIYNNFLEAYDDRNPVHINDDFAREKGFKKKVMHGNILGGFLSYMVGECLPEKNVVIISQEINFRNPVYVNDRIKLLFEVKEVFESVNSVNIKFVFTDENGIKLATGKVQIKYI